MYRLSLARPMGGRFVLGEINRFNTAALKPDDVRLARKP
jgi:hypothetical protein